MNAFPDIAARFVIAHELAHAWLAASGVVFEKPKPGTDEHRAYHEGGWAYVCDEEECEVSEICNYWGFYEEDDDWRRAHPEEAKRLIDEWNRLET